MSETEQPTQTPEGDFVPLDGRQAEAYERLMLLAASLQRPPGPPTVGSWLARLAGRTHKASPVPGLYLWGGVGRGKTHLMDCFFHSAPAPRKRRIHFHHFMRDIHLALAALPPQPDPLDVLAARIAEDSRLLCLDEFVVTDITDAMILHGLLRALFDRGVTLVTTSNTAPQGLYANGLQRERFLPAIELLRAHTEEFHLDGETDYRLRELERAETYFTPPDGRAHTAMEQLFERLGAGHEETDTRLLINDRQLIARRLAPGVAWFAFSELCEGPRATADYIEIAREYHSLLISDVPVLTPAHDAAARRFLHLVDEIYDRNVKLILSADATLEDLYQGADLSFEYQRLRSRLTEMQSVDYLARPHLPL